MSGLWRVGGEVGRNVYLDNVEVAVFVGAEGTAAALARSVVKTLNEASPVTPMTPTAEVTWCGARGPDDVVCQRKHGHGPLFDEAAHHAGYAESGELVRW